MKQSLSAEKIEKQLKEKISGEVRCDPLSRALYAKAACMYQQTPLGVVYPRDKRDVSTVTAFAREASFPLIGRGAGSSLNGQVIGEGLVLDFSKYMSQILHIGTDCALVQPGVVLARLNDKLRPEGKFFPPDPSSAAFATIGGMLGNNAGGARNIKYGATRDHVLSLETVLSDGERALFTKKEITAGERAPGTEGRLYRRLPTLLLRNERLLGEKKPRVGKNSSGYHLWDVLEGGALDLSKVIIGSEGTLALVTESRLNLLDLPPARALLLLFFSDLSAATETVPRLMELNPAALEIMDRYFLSLTQKHFPEIPEGTAVVLLTEFDGALEEVKDKIERARQKADKRAQGGISAFSAAEQEKLWRLRQAATVLLARLPGPRKPLSFIEDIAVPPRHLFTYMDKAHSILEKRGVATALHGHAGDGNFHLKPLLDYHRTEERKKMTALAEEIFSLARELGGTLSAEHGDGLARTPYLEKFYGKDLYRLFRQVKALFDPENIFNPGKIVTPGPTFLTGRLRRPIPSPQKRDPEEDSAAPLERCQGCGACRSFCPSYLMSGEESSLARGRANALVALREGSSESELLKSPAMEQLLDSCHNCRLCAVACPSAADISRLIVRERTRRVDGAVHSWAGRLQLSRDRLLSDFESLTRFASPFRSLVNPLTRSGGVRLLARGLSGLNKDIKLPPLQKPFLIQHQYRPHKVKGPHRAVFFYGCFVNYYRPAIGLALVKILEGRGIEVILPEQECCKVAMLNKGYGHTDTVRQGIKNNLSALLPPAAQGLPIISACPSCVHALRLDYPEILGGEWRKKARTVAGQVFEAGEYLLRILKEEKAPDKVRLDAAFHAPCHLKAIGADETTRELLRTVAELTPLRDNCCGMGGTFGFNHYESARAMGRELFEAIKKSTAKEIVTGCGACALQIRQQTGLKVSHPLEILLRAREKMKAS